MKLPLVLVGETGSRATLEDLRARRWGRLFVEKRPQPYPFEPWAFDNGAFLFYRSGVPFREDVYLRRLELACRVNSDPVFAVTPDIVAGGLASLEFSLRWLRRLPDEWPWYLAIQDGMTPAVVHQVAHLFSGLFLGGTDSFKGQAALWCRFAHDHGLRFHYARAGTLRRLRAAIECGADSVDSAFPLWTRARLLKFGRYFDNYPDQGHFFREGASS